MAWQRISAVLLILSVFISNAVAANSIKIADDFKSSHHYLKNFHADRRLREVPTGPNPLHNNVPPAAPNRPPAAAANGLEGSKSSKWKSLDNNHATRHLRDVPCGPNRLHNG